ncbi:hypothetical protein [Bacillus wiedmannii]|uniref:hypothetical protein n=1 Tax=Bacillus wiedmannii TaxID=1890302 RepID=UPI001145D495|nr:hypothetical protein [Bacillus wiedmannii]
MRWSLMDNEKLRKLDSEQRILSEWVTEALTKSYEVDNRLDELNDHIRQPIDKDSVIKKLNAYLDNGRVITRTTIINHGNDEYGPDYSFIIRLTDVEKDSN